MVAHQNTLYEAENEYQKIVQDLELTERHLKIQKTNM